MIGVSGRDYRVYFYHTYINQLSKNKGKKGADMNNGTNDNKKVTNGNQNGSADKRKRNTPPKTINLKNQGNSSSLEYRK